MIPESQPENHITSFLKNLSIPRTPYQLPVSPSSQNSENLFQQFDELYLADPERQEENPEELPTLRLQEGQTVSQFPAERRQTFTLDDIPPSQWRERILSFTAWLQADNQFYDLHAVLIRFLARIEGRLKEWYLAIGEYRRLQLQQTPSILQFADILYNEFVGRLDQYNQQCREEFLKMKCCSFLPKDLEKHYDRMSKRFYVIGGIDDVNLKQQFLNSFPEPLGSEAQKILQLQQGNLQNSSIAQLYSLITDALERLCIQKQVFSKLDKYGTQLTDACNKKHLFIKCKGETCDCSIQKKKHFKKARFPSFPKHNRSFKKKTFKRKWKFMKKRKFRGKKHLTHHPMQR